MTRTRKVGRLASMLTVLGGMGLSAVSCGTAGNSLFTDGGRESDSSLYFGGGGDAALVVQDAGNSCSPQSCQDQSFTCGINGDGCGGQISCGACASPQFCGGGGYSRCGTTPRGGGDGGADGGPANPCAPITTCPTGYTCGQFADGCGGLVTCGATDGGTCPSPQVCGFGGHYKCGLPGVDDAGAPIGADAGTACVPTTCAALGYDCGPAGDGCGGVIDCSLGHPPCASPNYCGGNGPSRCGGDNGTTADGGLFTKCVPTTCAARGYDCGPAGDGCGGVIDCSLGQTCVLPRYCGGAGPGKCGGNVNVLPDGAPVTVCVPKTCPVDACGPMSDGCGNLLSCSAVCPTPDTCGGGGVPFRCGHACTGLCPYQTACAGGATTAITGTVRAGVSNWLTQHGVVLGPDKTDPVPNVLVYIPNGTVTALGQGYAASVCPSCSADVSGDPLVSTYTEFDGTFTLTNVPVPPSGTVPVVIQMGRWRRSFTVPVTACTTNPASGPALVLNLPQNSAEGQIPLTAISTGDVDQLECVLLKMGIDQSEFTSSAGMGRVHIYGGGPDNGGKPGAVANGSTDESTLALGGAFLNYDQVMLPCWGAPSPKSVEALANLVSYADAGGHFFATHYSYTWLANNAEFATAANWDPRANNNSGGLNGIGVPFTGNVSATVPPSPPAPHVGTFAKWLSLVQALSSAAPPQVTITSGRHDVDSVANGSIDWIDGTDPNPKQGSPSTMLLHFAFDTPVGPAPKCGHAIFSDFHVTGGGHSKGVSFPAECDGNPLTSQERILEYMIWDLGACIAPPQPVCNPLDCTAQHIQCGPAGDGCGHPIASCGTCASPLTCGGGGVAGTCGEPDGGACAPRDCSSQNITCGPSGDGCGGLIASCGSCPAGQLCGGGGVAGQCGAPEAGVCTPRDCSSQNITCGPAGDGCGGLIASCGSCPAGQSCGAAGAAGQCGATDAGSGGHGACTPLTCADQSITCGPAGDGCGGLIASCGACAPPMTCGGGATPGSCGGAGCVPTSCAALGINCGPAGDGCGGAIDCGQCQWPSTCGGGGQPGVCGMSVPR